jgi:hypothetical protein
VHSNGCGPHWTGGIEESYDRAHSKDYLDPTDDLDTACQIHDILLCGLQRAFSV